MLTEVLLKIFTLGEHFCKNKKKIQSAWSIAVVIAFTSTLSKLQINSHMDEGIKSEDWVCNMFSDGENFHIK